MPVSYDAANNLQLTTDWTTSFTGRAGYYVYDNGGNLIQWDQLLAGGTAWRVTRLTDDGDERPYEIEQWNLASALIGYYQFRNDAA